MLVTMFLYLLFTFFPINNQIFIRSLKYTFQKRVDFLTYRYMHTYVMREIFQTLFV